VAGVCQGQTIKYTGQAGLKTSPLAVFRIILGVC